MSDVKNETDMNDFEGDISEKEVLLKNESETIVEDNEIKKDKSKLKPILAIIIDEAVVFVLAIILLQIVDFIMQKTVYYTFSDRSAALLLMFVITSVLYFSIMENLKFKGTVGKIVTKLNVANA